MSLYRLKNIDGCVVNEISAVQPTGSDPFTMAEEIWSVFPDLTVTASDKATVSVFTQRGDRLLVGWSDFLFEDPYASLEFHVLSARNFLDTYQVSYPVSQ